MTGFTLYCANRDFFYPTNRSRRTDALAHEVAQAILDYLSVPDAPTDATVREVKNRLIPCTMESHALPNGRTVIHLTNDTMCVTGFEDDKDIVLL